MNDSEKNEKFFKHILNFLEKNENGELIDLTEVYEDYGRPSYRSPRRILHYPRGKQLIELEIKNNDMQIEKVIKYSGKRIYGNFKIAMAYFIRIDTVNSILIMDLLFFADPDTLE